MKARQVFKELLPPLLVNLVRRRGISQQDQYIWRGVYTNFKDVPAVDAGHATEAHIEQTKRHTRRALDRLHGNELIVSSEYALPPLLVALVRREGRGFSILDVGGGVGISYIYLRASIPQLGKVDYRIVEVDRITQAGRELFAGDDQIRFLRELPGDEAIGKFDLIQFCNSLQYMEDYKSVISRSCGYRPRFIYLLKTPVGSFPTFATAQYNLPNSVAPVWFFNQQELVQLFVDCGYRLVYQGTHDRVYDTTNFDTTHRMMRYSHLLFSESSTK